MLWSARERPFGMDFGTCRDPCCGSGDIAIVLERAGRKVVSTDLVDRGYSCGGIDFLRQETPLAAAIVTNPLFKHAEAMLRHAVAIRLMPHNVPAMSA